MVGSRRQDFSLLRIRKKTSTCVSSRQSVKAALEIFSRVSRDGSVVNVLKFIDPVLRGLGYGFQSAQVKEASIQTVGIWNASIGGKTIRQANVMATRKRLKMTS